MQDAQITKQIEECQVVVWQSYQREYQWKPTFKQRWIMDLCALTHKKPSLLNEQNKIK